jgi:hypothetical protein
MNKPKEILVAFISDAILVNDGQITRPRRSRENFRWTGLGSEDLKE